MKKYLISFATKEFYKSQKKLEQSARRYGIDVIISYKWRDLVKTDFYSKYKNIFKYKRGAGYWLWKPYFILRTLEQMQQGDVLLYSDAGVEIINHLDYFFDKLKTQDYIFFQIPMLNKNWTKRDCFVLMNVDDEKYWNSLMFMATIIFFKKSDKAISFVKEWLEYATNENILTDKPNITNLPNFQSFKDHRHDQSILTNLIIKYNLSGESYEIVRNYFNIHRTRNIDLLKRIKNKIRFIIKRIYY